MFINKKKCYMKIDCCIHIVTNNRILRTNCLVIENYC